MHDRQLCMIETACLWISIIEAPSESPRYVAGYVYALNPVPESEVRSWYLYALGPVSQRQGWG